MRADGNCRACVVEIDGERVLAPSCCRAPKAGMKVQSARCARPGLAAHGAGVAARRCAGRSRETGLRTRPMVRARSASAEAASRRASACAGCQPSGHRSRSVRLHPVQPLPAGLPRDPGQ
ncbi:2Fe-2S iron-sulfur cluster-binding protein [Thauera humireducens]|uniref:2Fe-2S iron-sulfur cluster-binding protein n=1 Tax=Thauera humireducens TaxID=1134435 RepID=UPI0031203414